MQKLVNVVSISIFQKDINFYDKKNKNKTRDTEPFPKLNIVPIVITMNPSRFTHFFYMNTLIFVEPQYS